MKIDAAILAGGRSSRMGTDKAVLEVDGQTMIARVLEAARAVSERLFVVSNDAEKHAFLGVPIFSDEIKNVGPIGGIYTALQHCHTSHCLVVACDLPFLNAPALQRLIEDCDGQLICAAKSARGLEPLCAIYAKACLPFIEQSIIKKQLSLQVLFRELQTQCVDLQDVPERTFLNVNTAADLNKARERGMKTCKH